MISEVLGDEDEQLFITGMVVLVDLEGFTMSHITSTPIAMMKKLMPCFEVPFHCSLLFYPKFVENNCLSGCSTHPSKEYELHS
jgi:hypothetical protein